MCTITYLPLNGGYIVTQNRDESPLREEAVFPVEEVKNGVRIIYPKDPEGTGSWFVSTEDGITLCIMNGIFHADKKPGQFRHSRGLIPLQFLDFANTKDFLENYAFEGLEGFKLIACSDKGVDEIKWDEVQVTHTRHAPSNLIFQSDPLYNEDQKAIRSVWYHNFMNEHDALEIFDFHTQPQTDDPAIDIMMDRGVVQSVSTVQRRFFNDSNLVSYLTRGGTGIQESAF